MHASIAFQQENESIRVWILAEWVFFQLYSISLCMHSSFEPFCAGKIDGAAYSLHTEYA